jgi:hypothetical protein
MVLSFDRGVRQLRRLTTSLTAVILGLANAACGMLGGIPDSDTGLPKVEPAVPCKPIFVDGVRRDCLTDVQLKRWLRRNCPSADT